MGLEGLKLRFPGKDDMQEIFLTLKRVSYFMSQMYIFVEIYEGRWGEEGTGMNFCRSGIDLKHIKPRALHNVYM